MWVLEEISQFVTAILFIENLKGAIKMHTTNNRIYEDGWGRINILNNAIILPLKTWKDQW